MLENNKTKHNKSHATKFKRQSAQVCIDLI